MKSVMGSVVGKYSFLTLMIETAVVGGSVSGVAFGKDRLPSWTRRFLCNKFVRQAHLCSTASLSGDT